MPDPRPLDPATLHPETLAIRTQAAVSGFREHAVPLYLTSSFRFDDAEHARALFAEEVEGQVYSRYANPNTDELVDKLCLLEGGEDGIVTASGMSAVFTAIAALVKAGDHVVSSRALFGSTHQLFTKVFPRWGVASTYVDGADTAAWAAAITPATRLLYVESPSNPGLELADLAALGALAAARGIPLLVDNCFATPVVQRPIPLGASLVIHSATKYIDGQGRVLGGAIIGRRDLVAECRFLARHSGPALSAFNAWLLSKSLETLPVRMERHCANALALARHFEGHPALEAVRYPFLPSHPQEALARRQMAMGGGIVTLTVRGGMAGARHVVDHVRLLSLSANLGDTRTILTHPASTTHSKLSPSERAAVGIGDGLLRLSVGLEHVDDLIADLDGALAGVPRDGGA
ncbi:MAG: aminotransferase class I/II-fold pyridoxal phosphate-dependent enzyme [Gemmatimonadetes bacterium]|nr:aminotransferase class I/II-fold pyridoxal phosphate-dependent enzyme [Gemmatimonadota bacterium]